MAGFQVDGSDSFISKLAAGGARASLFEAEIDMAGKHVVGTASTMKFFCKGIQIPSNTIGVTTVMYKGRAVKLPGNRTYEDLTTTILNDEGYALRNQIENWMSLMNTHWGNVRDASHMNKLGTDGYTSSLQLKTFKKSGEVDGNMWQFYNCWPTSLDQIDVNWEPNDAIMEYTVNWAYDYWLTIAPST
jgi:hypothetical protein